MTQANYHNVILNDKKHNKPVCAVFTTSVWGKSRTLIPLMVKIISPTSKPLLSAGVFGSMAETTTGLEPWILNPNSPRTRITLTYLLHSERDNNCDKFWNKNWHHIYENIWFNDRNNLNLPNFNVLVYFVLFTIGLQKCLANCLVEFCGQFLTIFAHFFG